LSKQKYNITQIVTKMMDSKPKFLTFRAMIIFSVNIMTQPGSFFSNPDQTEIPLPFPDKSITESCRLAINEMMVDPTPVNGLPDAEWIELFNDSNCPVGLKDCKLTVGTATRTLPDSLVPPGHYVILCSSKNAPEMSRFGRIVVLSSFPALRNSGNHVALSDTSGLVIDAIDYSDSWYRNPLKKNGGWSLERIDPERNCGQPANWKASEHPAGGTPGSSNSVFAANPDTVKPYLISINVLPPNSVELLFSEPMDTLDLKDKARYRLSDGRGNPVEVTISDELTVKLQWKENFIIETDYVVSLDDLTDWCGNQLIEKQMEFTWMNLRQSDVVINEVLFNPWPEGVDFIELFNRSGHKINPEKLRLATRDNYGNLKSICSLKSAQSTFSPGGYLAFTADTDGIFPFYRTPCRSCICRVTSLPALNNDKGTVVLLNDSLLILDEFKYSEEMHHPLLYDMEGVSLERVNPDAPTRLKSNWQSASSETGFATPGFRNSQSQVDPLTKHVVTFEQTSFSPDNNGYNDEIVIHYETFVPGVVANCLVFDPSGRMICQILNNAILSTSGEIIWGGEDETGQKLPVGPYIILLEIFDMNGKPERFRRAVVLTERGE